MNDNDDDDDNVMNSIEIKEIPIRERQDICNSIPFSELSDIFDRISVAAKGTDPISDFIFTSKLFERLKGQSIYPLLRLLLPSCMGPKNESQKFNIAHKQLAGIYAELLHFSKDSDNYKTLHLVDGKNIISEKGGREFGSVLESTLKIRYSDTKTSKSIGEVNEILLSLKKGTIEDKKKIIENKILNNFSPSEQKWLARIISTQDLKINITVEKVLKKISETAHSSFLGCMCLKTVVEAEYDSVNGVQMSLMHPFAPMLAKSANTRQNNNINQITFVESLMKSNPFVMDIKLDGERMICHIDKKKEKQIELITRNGNFYTAYYTAITNSIKTFVKVDKCILDGEIIAWDNANKNFLDFGENRTVGKEELEAWNKNNKKENFRINLNRWLTYVVFDIVYLEDNKEIVDAAIKESKKKIPNLTVKTGVSYSGIITYLPLIVRRNILQKIFIEEKEIFALTKVKNVLDFCHFEEVFSDNKETRKGKILDYFTKANLNGEEGLVVKNLLSPYLLDSRKEEWVKMKPEYGDTVVSIDVMIIGCHNGTGHTFRGLGISTFTCAIKSSLDEGYHSFCRVGTGYNFEQLGELRQKLGPHLKPFNNNKKPDFMKHMKFETIPDYYIDPENSIVLEITCSEIVKSDIYTCFLTTRFPRVQHIRYDKSVSEIDTYDSIVALSEKPRVGLGNENSRNKENQSKKPRKNKNTNSKVDNAFSATNENVTVQSKIFDGIKFCVLGERFPDVGIYKSSNGQSKYYDRGEIHTIIKQNGGEFEMNPMSSSTIIIASKKFFLVNNYIAARSYDVLDYSYILDSVQNNSSQPIGKTYYMGMSLETEAKLKGSIDIFNDSYTEDITDFELKNLIMKMQKDEVLKKLNDDNNNSNLNKNNNNNKRKIDPKDIKDNKKEKERKYINNEYLKMKDLNWKDLAINFLLEDERDLLTVNQNSMWNPNFNFYVNISNDLGDMEIPNQINPIFIKENTFESVNTIEESILLSCQSRLLMYGAKVSTNLHKDITHIITFPYSNNKFRNESVSARLKEFQLNFNCCEKRIVSSEWIDKSIQNNFMNPPDPNEVCSL